MLGNVSCSHPPISFNFKKCLFSYLKKGEEKISHLSFKFNFLSDNSVIETKEIDDFPNALRAFGTKFVPIIIFAVLVTCYCSHPKWGGGGGGGVRRRNIQATFYFDRKLLCFNENYN